MPSQPDAEFIAIQAAFAGEYSLDRELGRGGIEAAQRVGEQIDFVVEANSDVEAFLRDTQQEMIATEIVDENDDADTPVGGVPAAHA